MPDKLLINYNLYKRGIVPLSRDSVRSYENSIVEAQNLIDNNKSRLERQTKRSPAIIELIEKLEKYKGSKTMVHTITLEDNRVMIVFTDLNNEEIIYLLQSGSV